MSPKSHPLQETLIKLWAILTGLVLVSTPWALGAGGFNMILFF